MFKIVSCRKIHGIMLKNYMSQLILKFALKSLKSLILSLVHLKNLDPYSFKTATSMSSRYSTLYGSCIPLFHFIRK